MASTKEFAAFVAEQLAGAGNVTFKKLFGEYGLWCDGKFFGTVEDNQFYIKITPAGEAILENPVIEEPHEGARMFLIEELEDKAFLTKLVQETCNALPAPRPRKKKKI